MIFVGEMYGRSQASLFEGAKVFAELFDKLKFGFPSINCHRADCMNLSTRGKLSAEDFGEWAGKEKKIRKTLVKIVF